jgi:hypothetical protein
VSRSWLVGEPGKWRIFCDRCYQHDLRTFGEAPDLGIFYAEGWYIGQQWDACPTCVAAGKFPSDKPHVDYPFPQRHRKADA